MKKVLLLFAACAVISMGAKAQVDCSVKAGLNVTNVSHIPTNKNKPSFHAGVVGEFHLTDFFSLQGELMYSRQGCRLSKEKGWKHRARVNYLNLPVLVKMNVWNELSVEVGPQFGILLNSVEKYGNSDKIYKQRIHSMNPVDLSLAVGVSYNIDKTMYVSARYNFGLSNVMEKDAVGDDNKNHVFQLSIGQRF